MLGWEMPAKLPTLAEEEKEEEPPEPFVSPPPPSMVRELLQRQAAWSPDRELTRGKSALETPEGCLKRTESNGDKKGYNEEIILGNPLNKSPVRIVDLNIEAYFLEKFISEYPSLPESKKREADETLAALAKINLPIILTRSTMTYHKTPTQRLDELVVH